MSDWLRFFDFFGSLNVHGINECCKWDILRVVAIRPDAQYKANDSCGRNGNKPCWNVEVAMAVPWANMKLGILFVTQLPGGAENVFIFYLHIA